MQFVTYSGNLHPTLQMMDYVLNYCLNVGIMFQRNDFLLLHMQRKQMFLAFHCCKQLLCQGYQYIRKQLTMNCAFVH